MRFTLGQFSTRRNFPRGMIFSFVFDAHSTLKVIGIRPLAPVQSSVSLKLMQRKGGFPVMAETTRNHIFSKEISQVIIAAMVLEPNFC